MNRTIDIVFRRILWIHIFVLLSYTQLHGGEIYLPQISFFANSGVERVIEDTGGSFTVEVGTLGSYTDYEFVESINATLSNSNWYWIQMESFTLIADQTGFATFHVSANTNTSEHCFTLRAVNTSFIPIRQLGYTSEYILDSGLHEVYHDEVSTIYLNSSTIDVTYTLCLDGLEIISKPGTGGQLSFTVDNVGIYTISASNGRVRGSIERRLYNFLLSPLIEPPVNPIQLSNEKNPYLLSCTCDPSVKQEQLTKMIAAYNNGLVSYWDPVITLKISSWNGTHFTLQVIFGPNTSDEPRINDSRIMTSDGYLIFHQNGGDSLKTFLVTVQADMCSSCGSITLGDSELGVQYFVCDATGNPLWAKTGTGEELVFDNIPSGIWSIRAHTASADVTFDTKAPVIARPSGSSDLTAVRSVRYTNPDGTMGMTDITYFDGLGRVEQLVQVRSSGSRHYSTDLPRDIITPVYYDHIGREDSRVYLPYTANDIEGMKVANVFAEQAMFHYQESGDSCSYSILEREISPQGRPTSSVRPGNIYRSSPALRQSIEYCSNEDSDAVMQPRVITSDILDVSTYYSSGTLSKMIYTDEDGRRTIVFADSRGNIILERRELSSGTNADTYYAYDILDSLRWVIPPECSARLNSTELTAGRGLAAQYCFIYDYDYRGNIVSFDRPGGGRTIFMYDDANRLVAQQDAMMSIEGQWHLWAYDKLGREILMLEVSGWEQEALYDYINTQDISQIPNQRLLTATYYDTYPSFAMPYMEDCAIASIDTRTKGLITCCISAIEGREDFRTTTYYYDCKSNIVQTIETDALGLFCQSTEWSFTGQPIRKLELSRPAGSSTYYVERTYYYDLRDRLEQETVRVNGGQPVTIDYIYDALGRECGIVANSSNIAVRSDVTMDLLGREVSRGTIVGDDEIFRSELHYHDITVSGSKPQYAGNISEWSWKRFGDVNEYTYTYSYDNLSRLVDTRLAKGTTVTNANCEKIISYDRNGNIKSMIRTNQNAITTNSFTYSYDGNQLVRLADKGIQSGIYRYDANGNMIYDAQNQLDMTWNTLGQLTKVSRNGSDLVNYSYLADGTKVSALNNTGTGLLYQSSLIYKCQNGTPSTLESVSFNGGRFVLKGEDLVPMFYVTDHLCSIRMIVNGNTGALVEYDDYYPFGTRWQTQANQKDHTNRYRYNAKEEQSLFNSPYTDYGARQYLAAIGRWHALDPLSEKYYSISPYAFCENNPVKYVDFDGRYYKIRIRWNTITIEATYRVERDAYKSAKRAVDFWNKRQDIYLSQSKRQYTVYYKLHLIITEKFDAFVNKNKANTYQIVEKFTSSNTSGSTENKQTIFVLKDYSIYTPNGGYSTTGAHEIGHTLGMSDCDSGIMSRSQDENRTEDLTDENIREMMNSSSGDPDLMSKIINLIFKVYENKR